MVVWLIKETRFSDSSVNKIDVTDISQFSFERVRIRNEDEGSTLKITADYDNNGEVDDTVFIFDQYNEDQAIPSGRAITFR